MNNRFSNLCRNALLVCLFFWFLLSFGRLVFNVLRISEEDVPWIGKTDDEKKANLFGNNYILFSYLQNKYPYINNILLLDLDGKSYYYGRYYLYPKNVYVWRPETQQVYSPTKNSMKYVVSIHNDYQANKKKVLKILGKDNIVLVDTIKTPLSHTFIANLYKLL